MRNVTKCELMLVWGEIREGSIVHVAGSELGSSK